MTPLMLTTVGVAIVAIASLISALRADQRSSAQAQLTLSLPLVATAVLLYFQPGLLSLVPEGLVSGETISLTVQYDLPSRGLGVIESKSVLAHPFAELLRTAFAAIAAISLFSALASRSTRQKSPAMQPKMLYLMAGVAWLIALIAWSITHVSLPFSEGAGESGVRDLLRLSALDPQRVKLFTVPSETWRLSTAALAPLVLSMSAAILIVSSKLLSKDEDQQASQDQDREAEAQKRSFAKLFSHLGSLTAVIAALWSASQFGFSGTPTELALWGSAVFVASATNAELPNASRGTVATLCLIALCAVTYP